MNAAVAPILRVWRDGAVRALPVWLLIAVALGNALAAVVLFRALRGGVPEVPAHQLIPTLWLPVGIYLLFGRARARCHQLELALPLSARALWLSHSASLALAAGSVLATTFGVMAANRLLVARLQRGSETPLELSSLVPPMAAALLLAVVLAQAREPGAWKLTANRGYWALMVGAQILILAFLLALGSRPWLATALLLVATIALTRRTLGSLPAAFELSADKDRAGHPAGAGEASPGLASSPVSALSIVRVLFTVVHTAPPWRQAMPLVLYSFVLFMGFVLSGVLELWTVADEMRLMNLPLGTYMLFAGAGLLSYHLHRLDPLPIRRGTLFRVLTLPSLVCFCLGFAGGRLLLTTAEPRPLVEYRMAKSEQWVDVDPAFLSVARDGTAPDLTAPWGETHAPRQWPLFRGSRLILYSPFDTREKSSARFEALLTSRAIEHLYGSHIPYTELLERYFEVDGEELVGLADGGLTLLADYPRLDAPPTGPETPIYLAIVVVPWLLLVALFARSLRATSSVKRVQWVYWAGLLVLLTILVGQFVLVYAGGYSPTAANGLVAIFVRWLGQHPLGTVAVWAGSLAAIVLTYRLAQAQFLRAELPSTPIRCALVDWGRSH